MRNGPDVDYRAFVDPKTGTVDRAIFSDQEIYEVELERIFARAWNFMCHESQIAKPGDFFLSFIGEESVIATRDKKGNLQVLLNTCRHRGNAVCRAEQGRATSFLCTYHGWTYDLEGRLVGVPGYKDFYHEALDREQWGLPKAAKVASYKGFVFANMDPDAPDLEDYLGPVGRMGLELMSARGEVIAIDGVQKNQIGCNWKLAVDNLFDWYHPQISHASAFMIGMLGGANRRRDFPNPFRVLLGDYGHAIGGPRLPDEVVAKLEEMPKGAPLFDDSWRNEPEARAALGDVGLAVKGHPNIFPNLWVSTSGTQLSLRLPKGPLKTEIWWFTILDAKLDQAERERWVEGTIQIFGPAGTLEQDDGENWDQSTRATVGPLARRYPMNFSMDLGHGQVQRKGDISWVDGAISEHAQLWTYRAWADWMTAETWDDLKTNRARPPMDGVI